MTSVRSSLDSVLVCSKRLATYGLKPGTHDFSIGSLNKALDPRRSVDLFLLVVGQLTSLAPMTFLIAQVVNLKGGEERIGFL